MCVHREAHVLEIKHKHMVGWREGVCTGKARVPVQVASVGTILLDVSSDRAEGLLGDVSTHGIAAGTSYSRDFCRMNGSGSLCCLNESRRFNNNKGQAK